jgi:predicted phage terminase large subunit-like protein
MHAPVTRDKLDRFERLLEEGRRRVARKQQSKYGWYDEDDVRQGGLIAFVRYFWHILEPGTPFVDGWPIWAICEHLEAVTRGEITRLLINVPPGFMKSMLVDVFWPAWEWGPMKRPHYRYVAFSYSASLTERDNRRFRDLIESAEYRRLYGDEFYARNKTVIRVINSKTGFKYASSVNGVGTGERGDRIIIDDPHNVKEAESEIVREETVRWFWESVSSRFNSLKTGAMVIIMQRVHEDDVSGAVLAKQDGRQHLDYCHLRIQMEYDSEYEAAPTAIGWVDPREEEGEVCWPDRFDEDSIERLKRELGPYGYAGQYQQSPVPRGGGIFQRDWWQLWEGKHPYYDYIIASLDGAFTEDEENDPSAMTVWGVFLDENRRRRIMLLDAWRKHLKFSGPRVDRLEEMTIIDGVRWMPDAVTPEMHPHIVKQRNKLYRERCLNTWGLVEYVADTCRRHQVDLLLIEAKASGISAAQEIRNRYGVERWGIQLMPVKGDKVARALAAVPTFSQLTVFAPERDWAQLVIDEMATFPRGRYDDLTDSATQAINYLRSVGLASSDEEIYAAEVESVTLKKKMQPLYPV